MGLVLTPAAQLAPVRIYFGMTIILSLVGWTGLARVVRIRNSLPPGRRILSGPPAWWGLAAPGSSCHMVPSFMSHIVASVTLSIPSMILESETSLSFLGLGHFTPAHHQLGVLLQEAQKHQHRGAVPVAAFLPGLFVVVTVLAFNFHRGQPA